MCKMFTFISQKGVIQIDIINKRRYYDEKIF